MKRDELNVFDSENKTYTERSMPYEKYFGEMALSKPQIKQRIEFARQMEDKLLTFMTLWGMVKALSDDEIFLRTQLQEFYFEVTTQYIVTDDYIQKHGEEFADNFIDATKRHSKDPWYTSDDRMKFDAENEANDILNYSDFQDAIEAGYTHKKWVAIMDKKTRDTHRQVNETVIPIEDTFEVGETLLRFPGDTEFDTSGGREIVNCRCSLEYL